MKIINLLSFKLFFLIVILLAGASLIIASLQMNKQSENYEIILTQCAKRTSAIIRSSTRHSMLLNQQEHTFDIIKTIQKQKGIYKIRVFNEHGKTVFSTDTSEINKKLKKEDQICNNCHTYKGRIVNELEPKKQKRIYSLPSGERVLSFICPIYNEKGCYSAQCHAHTPDQNVLGVLEVVLSLKATDKAMEIEKSDLISTNIALAILLALIVGIFIWIFVHIPISKILIGTKEVAAGNLDYKIRLSSGDEIGQLAASFNKMTDELRIAKKEITQWSEELENRVKEKTEQLEKTQERITQIEKMASLGQLSATVAHELNNPMAGILTYSKLIHRKIKNNPVPLKNQDDILQNLKLIETESDRCGKIIKDLLLFAKKQVPEFKQHNLNEIIDDSYRLIIHHLELHQIEFVKKLESNLPLIWIDDNQIKQILLALYVNAVEAMEDGGVLTVITHYNKSERKVYLMIRDNGKGIPEDILPHIFEPFFTTKNTIKGSGLGLSVVYGIVSNHNAEIEVQSKPDEGTTFIVKFKADNIKIAGKKNESE